MAVVFTNQIDVAQAVVARLIAQIPETFNSATCFLTDEPEPDPTWNVQHGVFATVALTDGVFDQEKQIGAGAADVEEIAGVTVTLWTRCKLDRASQATFLLTDEARGLLALKRKVLKALAGHDLQSGGDSLLVGWMRAVRATKPAYTAAGLGRLSLTFTTEFAWDLET